MGFGVKFSVLPPSHVTLGKNLSEPQSVPSLSLVSRPHDPSTLRILAYSYCFHKLSVSTEGEIPRGVAFGCHLKG